jgi:5'-3' exonuclease
MGIPTYFRYLFEQFGNEILSFSIGNVDHLYFDFNSIIYNVYYKNIEENKNQSNFLRNIYKELKEICLIVNPKKTVYLFLDGPVPRAKMVQQRSRRYKSVQLDRLLKRETTFNPSNNICPGTTFMWEMTKYLKQNFVNLKKELEHHPDILMSDSNCFGEGEHKMMPLIRSMNPTESLCVMSPDNDLLSLLILTGKKNIDLLRILDPILKKLVRFTEDSSKFIFIKMDMIRSKFKESQEKNIHLFKDFHEENVLLDLNFCLSLVGNDFVPVLPYMRIKSGGMNLLLSIYRTIINEDRQYLIDRNTLSINHVFFRKMLSQLSKLEWGQFQKLNRFISTQRNPINVENKTNEKLEDQINHLYLCHPSSPLYEIYQEDFKKNIFHGSSMNEIKTKYYNHFHIFGQKNKYNMIQEYLKSLNFTLLYYNDKCPSNEWFYKYRCAPLFSDILDFFLKNNDNDIDNIIRFEESERKKIFSPYQQLMMILPSSSKTILPKPFHSLFNKYKINYPDEFKVEALVGLKYIYSEAILPDFHFLKSMENDIKRIEKNQLSDFEKEKNLIL